MDKLYIIIPAYNEEENIEIVVREWHDVVAKINAQSRIIVIDDGSKDNTYTKLKELQKELPQLEAITKPNGGHGATVLYGYRFALEKEADYVFQTDSDRQTLPEEFWQFWNNRDNFSVIIGYRNHRQDGISRIFVTKVLKILLWCIFHISVTDANTPFRLMKKDVLRAYINYIPSDFKLANVLLTVYFIKFCKNVEFIPISFKQRRSGINSINFIKIIKIGKKAINDFISIKKNMKNHTEELVYHE
jgi:glycosyltransferase involved in cell wall biosynthesis